MKKNFLTIKDYENLLQYLKFDIENLDERLKEELNVSVHDFCKMKETQLRQDNFLAGISVDFVAYLMGQYHGVMMTCKDGENSGEHCVFVYPKLVKYKKPLYDENQKYVYDKNGEIVLRDSFKTDLFVCDPEADLVNLYIGKAQTKCFDIPLDEYKYGNNENQKYYIYTSMNHENRKNSILDFIQNKDNNRRTYKFDDLSGLKLSQEDVHNLSPKNKAYIEIRYNIGEMGRRQVSDAVLFADRKLNYQAISNLRECK